MKEKKTSSSFVSLYLMMMMKREEKNSMKKIQRTNENAFFGNARQRENIHSFIHKIVTTNIIKMERIKFKKKTMKIKKKYKSFILYIDVWYGMYFWISYCPV